MNELVADLIMVLHIALVLAIVWAPFSGSETAVVMSFLLLPFVFIHWLTANDTCALTVAECWFRGVPASESFFSKLIGSVYRVGYDSDCNIKRVVWIAAIGLWGVSAYRVLRDPAMIKRVYYPENECAKEKGEATREKANATETLTPRQKK